MEMLIFVNKANYCLELDHLTYFLFIDGLLNIYIIWIKYIYIYIYIFIDR